MNKIVKFGAITLSLVLIIASVLINFYSNKEKEVEIEEINYPAVRVNLINGCGYSNLANRIRKILYNKNLDIITCTNADSFIFDKTIIVIKKNNQEELKRLKKMTGISRFTYALNENSEVSFEIYIGKDYKKYFKE